MATVKAETRSTKDLFISHYLRIEEEPQGERDGEASEGKRHPIGGIVARNREEVERTGWVASASSQSP
jgi:hypothetical protein